MDKILVSYFSASGVTKRISETVARLINGDLFEIEPLESYTKEDLDWTNNQSRSSIEMHSMVRPKIANKPFDIDSYETILIGFPIWWFTAPTIINTFIEENDLTGKEIYIFVTSGGSSFGGSLKDLKEAYPNLNFVKGIRFNKVKEDEVNEWLNN